jgi:site-specific DNA-methyltransferase (adenine-specific)
MESIVHHADCMEIMAQYPDKHFDLAVVDPPYGIKADRAFVRKTPAIDKRNGRPIKTRGRKVGNWDNERPCIEYFTEIQRISKNQIIWGGNYFADLLPAKSCWLVWDKVNGTTDQADCELAWTSFNTAVRQLEFMWNGMLQGCNEGGKTSEGNVNKKESRIHPTQKPIKLYDWIYKNYLPEGGKVIDTHLGSGSNRIAADKAGNINFVGCELDKDYFDAQEKRWSNYKAQLTIQF